MIVLVSDSSFGLAITLVQEVSVAQKLAVRMSVRILDEDGAEIISFFGDELAADQSGFSAGLKDALLAFRRQYPNTRFIDVEFKHEDPIH